MAHDRPRRVSLVNQLLLLLMGVLVVYLVVDFGRQVALSRDKRDKLTDLDVQVRALLADQEELHEQAAYAESNEAAEEWARRMGWSKENEQPVVIVPPIATDASPDAAGAGTEATTGTHRQAWWELFFGDR